MANGYNSKKEIAQGIARGTTKGRKYYRHHTSGGFGDDAEYFNKTKNFARNHDITLAELEHFFETGERPKRKKQ